MRWLAVWLLLTVVYAAALVLCRPLAGAPAFNPLSRGDLANLLLIPAAQVAALAALAAASAQRRRAGHPIEARAGASPSPPEGREGG